MSYPIDFEPFARPVRWHPPTPWRGITVLSILVGIAIATFALDPDPASFARARPPTVHAAR